MTRKKRTSPAKDIMDLVAMLPWWVGIALAIVSYLLLHKIATTPLQVSAASGAGHVAALMPSVYLTALAQAGQYVIPILCIAGALISFVRKRKRNVLVMQVTESASARGTGWDVLARVRIAGG